jgi:hypothetical protein
MGMIRIGPREAPRRERRQLRSLRRPPHGLLAGIAAAAFLLGCSAGVRPTGSADSSSPVPGTTEDCEQVDVAASLAPYTIASLVAEGRTIVAGAVTAIDAPIYNTRDGTRPPAFLAPHDPPIEPGTMGQILTPVVLDPGQILSGGAAARALRVAIQGGVIGCDAMRVDVAPAVEIGRRYVFVLADAVDADGLTMPDLPLVRFAWPMDTEDVVATPEGALPLNELARLVAQAAPPSSGNPTIAP